MCRNAGHWHTGCVPHNELAESSGEHVIGQGTLDGLAWAVLVSPSGSRVAVDALPGIGGRIDVGPMSLGFGPWSIGYFRSGRERRVTLHGTTIPALRLVQIEDEHGGVIEVAVVYAKKELGVNVYLAFPRVRPTRIVGTSLLGHEAVLSVGDGSKGFDFSDD